jgi:hypothetical protein
MDNTQKVYLFINRHELLDCIYFLPNSIYSSSFTRHVHTVLFINLSAMVFILNCLIISNFLIILTLLSLLYCLKSIILQCIFIPRCYPIILGCSTFQIICYSFLRYFTFPETIPSLLVVVVCWVGGMLLSRSDYLCIQQSWFYSEAALTVQDGLPP